MELSEKVKTKLSEAIQEWADEVLPGRPAILGYAVFSKMERTLIAETEEVERVFPK